jgi:hypothetical protein
MRCFSKHINMNIPDKVNKDYYIDLDKVKKCWLVRINSEEPKIKERIYKLPQWLSDEIDYEIERAVDGAVARKTCEIRKSLGFEK